MLYKLALPMFSMVGFGAGSFHLSIINAGPFFATMNSDFEDPPPEEDLPSQPFEKSFPSTENSNAESCSISTDDLFSSLISTSPNGPFNTGGGQTRALYKCRRCGRHFGRLDHVKRHCRSREFVVPVDLVK